MMMTVDEKLHAYAKNQKDRNIDEKKLQQTIIKSKEAYWDGEIERNMSWLEFLYQQASYIQKHWWFAQGAVLLILWMTMFLSDSSIYTRRCMGILAPSFVILILPELWKNRSNGAMEVEGATFFFHKEYICRTNATLRHGRCLPIECVFDNQHFCVTDCIYGYLNTIYFANECDMLHMFSITLQ